MLKTWMVGPMQTASQDLSRAGKPGFCGKGGRGCMHGVVVVHLPPSPSSVMVDEPCLTIASQELSRGDEENQQTVSRYYPDFALPNCLTSF